MTSLSCDPAAQLLSANRNQTVAATVPANTGVPVVQAGSSFDGNNEGGATPGATQGIFSQVATSGGATRGAVSPGAESGSGQPGLSAAVNNNSGIGGGLSTYSTPAGGQAAVQQAPGGANGVTPANSYEVLSRTS